MQAKYGSFISIALAITIISCANESQVASKFESNQTSSVSDMASAAPAAPPMPEGGTHLKQKLESRTAANEADKSAPSSEKIEVIERKIIKTGDIRFETKDLDQTITSLINNDALSHSFSISIKYFIDYNQVKGWF